MFPQTVSFVYSELCSQNANFDPITITVTGANGEATIYTRLMNFDSATGQRGFRGCWRGNTFSEVTLFFIQEDSFPRSNIRARMQKLEDC